MLTPPVTSLFRAISILCPTNSPKTGKEEAPHILQQECEMCPSLLDAEKPFQPEQVHRALSALTGAAHSEGSSVCLHPAQPA